MEDETKSLFRAELSRSGLSKSKISLLENKLLKSSFNSDKLVGGIASYGRNLDKSYRKVFYEKAVDTISQYSYTDTIDYLSSKLFSLDNERIMDTLEVLGKDYLSFYVNFIDLSYKHSKGIEFIDKLFSLDKLNEDNVKDLMKKDIEMKDIKELIPREIFSNLY